MKCYGLDQQGRTNWASCAWMCKTIIVFYKYNFHDVWDQQGVVNKSVFLKEFVCRIEQVYIDERHSSG